MYFGHFLSHAVRAPLAKPIGNVRTAEVIRTEEKGSDVNLPVHLLNDGWLVAYECAVVVTNDSDIAEAMRLVTVHYGKRIGLLTPGSRRSSGQLRANANFTRRTRESVLRLSQLPNPIPGTNIRSPGSGKRMPCTAAQSWVPGRGHHTGNDQFARAEHIKEVQVL